MSWFKDRVCLDEILVLVTVDGFVAAMWEKHAQSQGFGIFGPGRAGGGILWEGSANANREPGSYLKRTSHLVHWFTIYLKHAASCGDYIS